MALGKEATGLFTDIKKTGECGEILLYAFTNSFLKIPQVLCKMPLKTSSHMHYHGVDGLHAKYDETTKQLLLYWGESKVHSKLATAMSSCFGSIKKMLIQDDSTGNPRERDLRLFRDHMDLENKDLEGFVLEYLNPDSEKNLRLKHCGICLIGFDEEAYKKVTEDEIKSELQAQISKWKESLKNNISKEKLENYDIHVFLIPFPSAENFRACFLKEVSG